MRGINLGVTICVLMMFGTSVEAQYVGQKAGWGRRLIGIGLNRPINKYKSDKNANYIPSVGNEYNNQYNRFNKGHESNSNPNSYGLYQEYGSRSNPNSYGLNQGHGSHLNPSIYGLNQGHGSNANLNNYGLSQEHGSHSNPSIYGLNQGLEPHFNSKSYGINQGKGSNSDSKRYRFSPGSLSYSDSNSHRSHSGSSRYSTDFELGLSSNSYGSKSDSDFSPKYYG